MSCASSWSTSSPDLLVASDGLDPSLRGSLWRHRKTQGVYRILGKCRIEATGTDAFLYQGDEGTIWARPMDEFLDGRFERLAPEAAL
ncbi:hypothetical protein [Pannonibacter sp.]|uniref:hypothetical protein n=1 Tax=Pannonibacter sp. TaxID=1906786 RepID=UPI003F703DC8